MRECGLRAYAVLPSQLSGESCQEMPEVGQVYQWLVTCPGRGYLHKTDTLLDVPGATLLMLPRLLIDDLYRNHLINRHVEDPVVRAFWLNEYAAYSASFRVEAIAPIQNKIGKALMVPALRNMLAQPKSTITMRRLMDERAIVIVNLSKGALGESTAHLLGALLITAVAQAALSRG